MRSRPSRSPRWRSGTVYSYSFAGLLWPAGAAGLWALVELALAARRDSPVAPVALARRAAPATGVALAALAVAVAPGGRANDRVRELRDLRPVGPRPPPPPPTPTPLNFIPGPGLGNLFNPISPLEALGIWPSGDFRLDPGDGAMPAAGFYLGEALGVAALAYGLAWWLRRGERAVPAALAAAAALFAYAHFAGTPYQAAKAIVIASPLAMLIAARALLGGEPLVELGGFGRGDRPEAGRAVRDRSPAGDAPSAALGVAFLAAAAGCSALALVNGPVGPATYSPALTELRPALGADSTLVLAPRAPARRRARPRLPRLGASRRPRLRRAEGAPSSSPPPHGAAHVITQGSGANAAVRRSAARASRRPLRALASVSRPREATGPAR